MNLPCGDVLGALNFALNNTINPVVAWPAVLVSPLSALAAIMLAVWAALMACFN